MKCPMYLTYWKKHKKTYEMKTTAEKFAKLTDSLFLWNTLHLLDGFLEEHFPEMK